MIRSAILPASRTCKRAVAYDDGRSVLSITTGRKSECYHVAETVPGAGWSGRSFRLTKLGPVAGCYDVLVSADGCRCDCAGASYEAAHRANERATRDGKVAVATLGCKHADAVQHAIAENWLPDPRERPADVGSVEDDADRCGNLEALYREFAAEEAARWREDTMLACFAGCSPTTDNVPF